MNQFSHQGHALPVPVREHIVELRLKGKKPVEIGRDNSPDGLC